MSKKDYENIDLLTFQAKFKNEADCWDWLIKTRYPEGYKCPRCGSREYYFKKKRRLFSCKVCRYENSVTAGTIFHKTKTHLLKWFWLIFRMAISKTGVSIAEMQRELEVKDYKTMWVMAHKIRKAMQDRDERYRLDGLVEIDEGFFGPKGKNTRGRGTTGKKLVIIAVSTWVNEENDEKPGFARAFVVDDASADTVKDILARTGSSEEDTKYFVKKIRTDGWASYTSVAKELKLEHQRFVLRNSAKISDFLPWTHQFISNAKAVFGGAHRGISTEHLQRYLSEVCYRFNRRWWQHQIFHRLLKACVSTETITRKELGIRN